MPKKKQFKWKDNIGLALTIGMAIASSVATYAVLKYQVDKHESQIELLWQKKAPVDYVAEKISDFKVKLDDHEGRLRTIEQRRK